MPTLRLHHFVYRLILAIALTLALGATGATADPYAPVTTETVIDGYGARFSPGFRPVEELEQDYVEDEFFAAGASDVFNYTDPDNPKPDQIAWLEEESSRLQDRLVLGVLNRTAPLVPPWSSLAEGSQRLKRPSSHLLSRPSARKAICAEEQGRDSRCGHYSVSPHIE